MRGKKWIARGELHVCAERALRVAVQRSQHLVIGEEIARAWREANGREVPANVLWRWQGLLKFGLEDGTVTARRERAKIFWGVSDLGDMPLPPPAPRCFSQVLLDRCALAERALASAVATHGRLVNGPEICAHGLGSGVAVVTRLPRTLEPAIQHGRVVSVRDPHGLFYGPANRPDLSMPQIHERSDLFQVEQALRLAVESRDSAVPPEVVSDIMQVRPEFALRSSRMQLSRHLAILVREGRAKRVPTRGAAKHAKAYYTTLDGPTRVADDTALTMDRRRRAIQVFWRSSGERPFTTAALRRFVSSREEYRIPNDPKYGWNSALQTLKLKGEVTVVRERDCWVVRWALAGDWSAVDESEKVERLRDEYRVVEALSREAGKESDVLSTVACVLSPTAPVHDVGFASRNRNMRTLVAVAKQIAVAAAANEDDARILDLRPVTLDLIRRASARCLHLLGGESDVHGAVKQAARIARGMKRSAVWRAGTVGRVTYYDVEPTDAGTAFVEFKQSVWDATRERLCHKIETLRESADLSFARVHPLPELAIGERARALLEAVQAQCACITSAMSRAPLLANERDHAQAVVRQLEQAGDTLKPLVGGMEGEGIANDAASPSLLPDELVIDADEAWRQIAPVAEFTVARTSQLVGRIRKAVMTVRLHPDKSMRRAGGRQGRRREVYFDRVAFAAWAAMRWAGPGLATIAATGLSALGSLRTPGPFISCLADSKQSAVHASVAAALSLFDDRVSRAALTDYLVRSVEAEERGEQPLPMSALACAAYGLSQKPMGGLATSLAASERSALERLALRRQGDYAGECARRVLVAWADGWSREQLLRL